MAGEQRKTQLGLGRQLIWLVNSRKTAGGITNFASKPETVRK